MSDFHSPQSALLKAQNDLNVSDTYTTKAIASFLGLTITPSEETVKSEPSFSVKENNPVKPKFDKQFPFDYPDDEDKKDKLDNEDQELETEEKKDTPTPIPSHLMKTEPERSPEEETPISLPDHIEPLPKPSKSKKNSELLPLEPLLRPDWTRAILSMALSTQDPEGAIDVEAIVEHWVRGEHLPELPRRPSLTLRRGVQVLVDRSQSMTLFSRDRLWLQQAICRVVGEDRTKIFNFAGCPSLGVSQGSRRQGLKHYQLPAIGTPVVLLTDFGLAKPYLFGDDQVSLEEWVAFCRKVGQAGCPLLAFVPYAPSRWPQKLSKLVIMVQWDRTTTVGGVSQTVTRSREKR